MTLVPVDEALARILAGLGPPLQAIMIDVEKAAGLTLASDVLALRDQPPFPISAMDGYALRSADLVNQGSVFGVIGQSAAGASFKGEVGPGEAVRIFTGARVPEGADTVLMQEDARRAGDEVSFNEAAMPGRHIRVTGLDFREGAALLKRGTRLDARHLALAAAMGHGRLSATRRPRVAILATGDELVRAGEAVGADQIIASSVPALAAITTKAGGEVIDLGIARDSLASLDERIGEAVRQDADILVTLGGASVGDHDLVQKALSNSGMNMDFWRIALRPGKPMMYGKLGTTTLLGLPGNPVSTIVCAILFLVPAIRALSGDPDPLGDPAEPAILGADMPTNGIRRDYLRARLLPPNSGSALPVAEPHAMQDSSMLAILAQSDALLIREPHAPAAKVGEPCRILKLQRFC
jgi:molybdopterin molybdotransferase